MTSQNVDLPAVCFFAILLDTQSEKYTSKGANRARRKYHCASLSAT
jgi:hypothetical protein